MQRRALTVLFAALTVALAAVALYSLVGAHSAARWLVGVAALALAGWFAGLALSLLRGGR